MNLLRPEETGATPFGEIFSAQSGQHNLLFAHSGWGKTATAAACQHLIDSYHPRLIINLGTCGGLEGHAQVGEVLLAAETAMYDVVESMSDYAAALERYRTRADLSWLPDAFPQGVRKARIVSAAQDIQIHNFDLIAGFFQAPGADWESAAFAWTAAKNKTRWLILRASVTWSAKKNQKRITTCSSGGTHRPNHGRSVNPAALVSGSLLKRERDSLICALPQAGAFLFHNAVVQLFHQRLRLIKRLTAS